LREKNARLNKRVKATKGKRVDESGHTRPKAIFHEIEEEGEYNLTMTTKRVTNNSSITRNTCHYPFIDGITKTRLPK